MSTLLRALRGDITTLAVDATVNATVQEIAGISEVIFCCFSEGDLAIYERLLRGRGL